MKFVLPAFVRFAMHYNGREYGLHSDASNAASVAGALRDGPEHLHRAEDLTTPEARKAHRERIRKYRKSLLRRSSAYAMACDFANAWKHADLDRSDPVVSSIDAVDEFHAFVKYRDTKGYYYALRKFLVITTTDGVERDLPAIILEALQTWCVELVDRSVIPKMPRLPQLPPAYLSREQVEKMGKLQFFGMQYETFESRARRLVYREHGCLTPVSPGEHFEAREHAVFHILPSPFDE